MYIPLVRYICCEGLEHDYVRISGDVLADRQILAKPEKAQERNLCCDHTWYVRDDESF